MERKTIENYLEFCKINYLNPSNYESLKEFYITKEKEQKLIG